MGAIVRLPASVTLAAIMWLPPVTMICAALPSEVAIVRLPVPETPGVSV